MGLALVCLGGRLWAAIRGRWRGFSPYLFVGCTLAAMIIPTTSFDDKLPILAGPMAVALYLCVIARLTRWAGALAALASSAYSSTLFSYAVKPKWLRSNLPALLGLLLIFTLFALTGYRYPATAWRANPLVQRPDGQIAIGAN